MRRPVAAGAAVVVKVGSSSLAGPSGGLDDTGVDRTITQVLSLRHAGYRPVLVSSGAVAAGLPALGLSERPRDLPGLQVAAAVGQGRLMERYAGGFGADGVVVGQVLLTRDILAHRAQYLHAREALTRMLSVGVIPIVNENDTVVVDELKLGDNDRLAAIVGHLVGAGMLVLLTDTIGLFSADPRLGEAELLSAVRHTDAILDELNRGAAPGTTFGSGGVATKIAAARMAAWSGIPTVVADARQPDVAVRAVAGEDVGTWIDPQPGRLSARRLWIAFGLPSEGTVTVDDGAARALVEWGKSLLPVGVVAVDGSFGAQAAVEVFDPEGVLIAKGRTGMGADAIRSAAGQHSRDVGLEAAGWSSTATTWWSSAPSRSRSATRLIPCAACSWSRSPPGCPSSTEATGSPWSTRRSPPPSSPVTDWSSCRSPAICSTYRPPVHETVTAAVDAAVDAFAAMGAVDDGQIDSFFSLFADRLADDDSFAPIASANEGDVAAARDRGRSVTRLVLSEAMRAGMVDGLRGWAAAPSGRGAVVETVEHPGWRVELVRGGLGVVGFVFEGRPNVFADGAGVLRSGNTMVFRIGSDALGTARAIVEHALDPALAGSGLPPGAVSLVASPERSAGWALFSDPRLSLAVARGSGPAVAQLGAVARQAGLPVSLHGTGGAWIVASASADPDVFASVVLRSLDRKVCNTLNTCCVVAAAAADLVPRFLSALDEAGERREAVAKLHVDGGERSPRPRIVVRHGADHPSGGRRGGATHRAARPRPARAGMGVGGQPRGDADDRARRGHRGAAVQRPEPALHRQPGVGGRVRAATLLRHDRRPLRRRRLHPLGRRAVRPRSTRARARQLAVRQAVRPRRDPQRRLRLHPAHPGHPDRPPPRPLTLGSN